ncbi:hypothetical protein V6Z11_A04G037400 [Gossypium hirsutum]
MRLPQNPLHSNTVKLFDRENNRDHALGVSQFEHVLNNISLVILESSITRRLTGNIDMMWAC